MESKYTDLSNTKEKFKKLNDNKIEYTRTSNCKNGEIKAVYEIDFQHKNVDLQVTLINSEDKSSTLMNKISRSFDSFSDTEILDKARSKLIELKTKSPSLTAKNIKKISN